MNLIKNVLIKDFAPKTDQSFTLKPEKLKIAQGLCITCSNRPHCVWLENNKLMCEHFD